MAKPLRYRDLPTDTRSGVLMVCRRCGEEYSAAQGDYFWAEPDEVIQCRWVPAHEPDEFPCGGTMRLVTKRTVYRAWKPALAVILLMLLPRVSMAQTLGYVGIIGGNVADGWTTVQALNRGAVEANPLYGRYPSTERILLVKGTTAALQCALVWTLTHTGHPKAATWLGVSVGAGYGLVAWHNTTVMSGRTVERVQPVPVRVRDDLSIFYDERPK